MTEPSKGRSSSRVDRDLSRLRTGVKVGTERKIIEAARQSFIAAMRRNDVTALVGHYEEEAIVVPQNAGVCRGRAAIRKLFASWLSAATVREFDVDSEDLRIVGDAAFAVGTYRMVIEDAGSGPVRDEGKFLIVYERKSNGTWLIARDMSISSKR